MGLIDQISARLNGLVSTADQITRSSKSNLALSFVALPRDRRRDISIFYAFCRLVDDIADEPGPTLEQRRAALDLWRESLEGRAQGEAGLAAAVRTLISKYSLPTAHFREIIAGVEMDLSPAGFDTWDDLRVYCHRVASVVGLVSIEVFGYRDPRCREYAIDLGLALQLTNILRDVGQDYANGGRIYLPREDLARFGYAAEKLAVGCRDDAFLELMDFEANRAGNFYRSAHAALPATERHNMRAAEIMRSIYERLLRKMQRDGFQIFNKRYRLNRLEKAFCVGGVLLKDCHFARASR